MSLSFSTRKSPTGGWYVSVEFNNTTIDLGRLNVTECAELAATLRETAEEIDPTADVEEATHGA